MRQPFQHDDLFAHQDEVVTEKKESRQSNSICRPKTLHAVWIGLGRS